MQVQREGVCLHAKERGLGSNRSSHTLISDFESPELRENKFLLFKPPSMCYLVRATLTNQYTALPLAFLIYKAIQFFAF